MNSILKKAITAVSGLGLVGFLVTHLAGNLTLLSPDPQTFNRYALGLHNWGGLMIAAELGLGGLVVLHVINGILLKLNHRAARPIRYKQWQSKKGESKANSSSLMMAVSGTILLVFLIVHVVTLRFGASIAEGYVTTINGEPARDLQRLVAEKFASPLWVFFYLVGVGVVGWHLRHGFWSAFQSLGVSRPKLHRVLKPLGLALRIVLVLGFASLPIVLYLRSGGAQ